MNSVLITGANRGIGLGMVEHLLKYKKAQKIIAACRKVSEELQQLSNKNKNLTILHLDLSNISSFGAIPSQIDAVLGDQGLTVLINNAGVTTKFTTIGLVREDQLLHNLTINTIAPIMLTKTLLPALKRAAAAGAELAMGARRAAVLNVSSELGSIARNDRGGFYPYRCSKAALNAATKSMSLDLKKDRILVVSVHPGWVRTGMGGRGAPLDVGESVDALFDTVGRLGERDSGKFLQYDGAELPW